jgi:excisionase family DNA binding protein
MAESTDTTTATQECDRLMRALEVAELLGVTRSKVYQLASERAIGHRRYGRTVVFTTKDVSDYIRRNTFKPRT